ncbi:MAG: sulfurtransferase TusA family protein [Candidatus Poribacteria bacterium]
MSDEAHESPTAVVDARGLLCPMPLVRASQAAKKLAPGEWIRVLATDRGSVPDFQAWIDGRAEYDLVHQDEEAGDDGRTVYVHDVKRV